MPENIWTIKDRLSERDLAEYWDIKLDTLRKWRTTGTSPVYIKIGGRVIYTREAIAEYERNRMFRGSAERIMPTKQGGNHDTEK